MLTDLPIKACTEVSADDGGRDNQSAICKIGNASFGILCGNGRRQGWNERSFERRSLPCMLSRDNLLRWVQ